MNGYQKKETTLYSGHEKSISLASNVSHSFRGSISIEPLAAKIFHAVARNVRQPTAVDAHARPSAMYEKDNNNNNNNKHGHYPIT